MHTFRNLKDAFSITAVARKWRRHQPPGRWRRGQTPCTVTENLAARLALNCLALSAAANKVWQSIFPCWLPAEAEGKHRGPCPPSIGVSPIANRRPRGLWRTSSGHRRRALNRDRDRWSSARRISNICAVRPPSWKSLTRRTCAWAAEGGKAAGRFARRARSGDRQRPFLRVLLPHPERHGDSHGSRRLGRAARLHPHEPVGGSVVAFSAFNHPLNLIVHQVGPGGGGLPRDW